ncbi:MAG: hypothetical protein ACLUE2_17180 [Bacteroides cellulosilyticus]
MDEGIAYIQNNSPVYYYEPHWKIGMVYDAAVKEDGGLYQPPIKDFTEIRNRVPELVPWTGRAGTGLLVNGENRSLCMDIIKELFRYQARRHR